MFLQCGGEAAKFAEETFVAFAKLESNLFFEKALSCRETIEKNYGWNPTGQTS